MNSVDLRRIFNTEAELYHSIRPTYPEALFDAMIEVTRLSDDASLLEIAPGTGQATRSLAKRGYGIVAVELGAELVKLGQKALEHHPNVRFVNADFETVALPNSHFDLIYVATAIHWIRPDNRFRKPHQLLKADGHLAIIHTAHVSDDAGDEFFYASQPIYQKYTSDKTTHLPQLSTLKSYAMDANLFTLLYFNTFIVEVAYSAKAHVQLLNTYSQILSLDSESRMAFLRDIEILIDRQFGGSIVMRYAFTLTIGKRNTF